MVRYIVALLLSLALPFAAMAQEPKAAPNPELRAYQVQVRDRVLEYWQPPDIENDTRLQVFVRVDRDGKVSKREVKTLDGAPQQKEAEEAALQAVLRAQPFPTVPSNVAPFYVDVRFNLKIAAKPLATPRCFPVPVFIDLPEAKQAPVLSGFNEFTGKLRDSVGDKILFQIIKDRTQADLIVEASEDPKLPWFEKTNFVGRYTLNEALTVGTLQLGLKNPKTSAPLTDEQLTANTMQLLGRVVGLSTSYGAADSIMSDVRFAPRLTTEQSRLASDTVKAGFCTPQSAARGFVVRATDGR